MKATKLPGRIVGPHTRTEARIKCGLGKNFGPKLQSRGREADRIEVEPVLLSALKGRWAGNHLAQFLDDGYYLPTVEEVSLILARSSVSRFDYVDQLFDCDDFAFGVRGEFSLYAYEGASMRLPFAVGLIMGGFQGIGSNHAMCVFVDDTLQVHLIEPRQGNEKFGAPNARNHKNAKFAHPAICYDCYLLLV